MQLSVSRKRLCSSRCESSEGECEQENVLPQRRTKHVSQTLNKDVECFLASRGMMGLMQQPQLGPLGAPYWLALAELNITLAAFQYQFHELRLLESHFFSRCPKSIAFEKLAFSRGCTDVWALHQSPHLQAVSLVLQTALAGCQETAISQVTLRCPPFLAGWAARWLPSTSDSLPPRIRLTILQGYNEGHGPLRATTVYNLGLPTICSTPAQATVYVPMD